MVVPILISLVALVLLYYWLTKNYKYWESRGVPFAKPFLFFGNFYDVATGKCHIFHTIRSVYQKFDTPYVGFYIFNQPNLIVRDPDLIKKILVKDFDKFQDRNSTASEEGDPIAFHSMLTAKGAIWKVLRAKISPVFTAGKMKMMVPLIKECAQDLVDCLSKNQERTVEFKYLVRRYTVDVISSCAFGFNANCLKENNVEMMDMAINLLNSKGFKKMITNFTFFFFPDIFTNLKMSLMDKTAVDYMLRVFKDTLRKREQFKIVRNDFIDLLKNIKQNENISDNYKFDDFKMLAQAIIFFSAGNDTTSMTTVYMLYELALNKDMQERLRLEVIQSFDKDSGLTYEAIQEMKYMNMVACETLRKYPIAPLLTRQTTTDYIVETTGLKIDKDINITIPVAGLHYDARYFPEPDKFDPERFSDQNRPKIPPYTYLPFGDGPRACIGMRFSILVVKVAVAFLLKEFALEVDSTTPVSMEYQHGPFLSLDAKFGIPLKVRQI